MCELVAAVPVGLIFVHDERGRARVTQTRRQMFYPHGLSPNIPVSALLRDGLGLDEHEDEDLDLD